MYNGKNFTLKTLLVLQDSQLPCDHDGYLRSVLERNQMRIIGDGKSEFFVGDFFYRYTHMSYRCFDVFFCLDKLLGTCWSGAFENRVPV